MRLLVDSSVWIDYFNGRPTPETDALDAMLGREEILVGDIILGEVLQGFRRDQDFEQTLQALRLFPWVEMLGPEVALESARNYRRLRKMGVTVRKTIDSFIATWCILHDAPLLHSDRDFDAFEERLGLWVIHPHKATE